MLIRSSSESYTTVIHRIQRLSERDLKTTPANSACRTHAAVMRIQEAWNCHTDTCKYCGINWCSNYELKSPDVERYYKAASISLQARGCSGVTSAWPHARNSRTGTVYAVDPASISD